MNERMKNIQKVIQKCGIFTALTPHYIISIVNQPNGDFRITILLRDSMGLSEGIPVFIYRNGKLAQEGGIYPVKWDWPPDMFVAGLLRNWAELYWPEEAEKVKEYLHSLIIA